MIKNMKILAIDTSTEACCVMAINGHNISTLIEKQPRKHNEVILDLITNVLDNVNMHKSEIEFFAIGIGPGSFVGVRMGVALIKALSIVLVKPIITFSSMMALAASANKITGHKNIQPILNARMGDLYTATYSFDQTNCLTTQKDIVIKIVDINIYPNHLLVGEGISLIQHSSEVFPDTCYINLEDMSDFILQKALNENTVNALNLEPIYLRGDKLWKKIADK